MKRDDFNDLVNLYKIIAKNDRELYIQDDFLNMIEMAFRTYDPCLICDTYSILGHIPLEVKIYNNKGKLFKIEKSFLD